MRHWTKLGRRVHPTNRRLKPESALPRRSWRWRHNGSATRRGWARSAPPSARACPSASTEPRRGPPQPYARSSMSILLHLIAIWILLDALVVALLERASRRALEFPDENVAAWR